MRCPVSSRLLDFKWLSQVVLAAGVLLSGSLGAAEVSVIGVFPGRGAVLVVEGGAPQSFRIGQTLSGVTLVSVEKTVAVIEEAGRRRTLALGPHLNGAQVTRGRGQQAVLAADGRGHFLTDSTVNGASIRFLVDTGATLVALPGKDARRLGIDFSGGPRGYTQTANGPAPMYRVKLDSVKVGDIELLNVDAVVLDGGGLAQPLLGMSFLNRVEMVRDGDSMTLKRRY
jgi:aspartyl protease family protein